MKEAIGVAAAGGCESRDLSWPTTGDCQGCGAGGVRDKTSARCVWRLARSSATLVTELIPTYLSQCSRVPRPSSHAARRDVPPTCWICTPDSSEPYHSLPDMLLRRDIMNPLSFIELLYTQILTRCETL